jgi:hypothetical protein
MRAIVFEGSASMPRRGALALVELSPFDVTELPQVPLERGHGEPRRDFCSRSDMTPSPIGEQLAVYRLFPQTGSVCRIGESATPQKLVIFLVTPAILIPGGASHGEEAQANCQADRQTQICIKEGAAETPEGGAYRRACRVNPRSLAEDFEPPLHVQSVQIIFSCVLEPPSVGLRDRGPTPGPGWGVTKSPE